MNRFILLATLLVLAAVVAARGGHGHHGRGGHGRRSTVRIGGRAYKLPAKPAPIQTCSFYGDPHYTTFRNKYYNVFPKEDGYMAKGPGFYVAMRHHKWIYNGPATIATAVVIKYHGTKLEYYAIQNAYYLNGREHTFKTGTHKLGHKFNVNIKDTKGNFAATLGKDITFSANNAGGGTPYLNLILTMPASKVAKLTEGACGNNVQNGGTTSDTKTNHFAQPYDPYEFPGIGAPPLTPSQRDLEKARAACRHARDRATRKGCEYDFLHTGKELRKTVAKQVLRIRKKQHKHKKVQKKKRAKQVRKWKRKVKKAIKKIAKKACHNKHGHAKKKCLRRMKKKLTKKVVKRHGGRRCKKAKRHCRKLRGHAKKKCQRKAHKKCKHHHRRGGRRGRHCKAARHCKHKHRHAKRRCLRKAHKKCRRARARRAKKCRKNARAVKSLRATNKKLKSSNASLRISIKKARAATRAAVAARKAIDRKKHRVVRHLKKCRRNVQKAIAAKANCKRIATASVANVMTAVAAADQAASMAQGKIGSC